MLGLALVAGVAAYLVSERGDERYEGTATVQIIARDTNGRVLLPESLQTITNSYLRVAETDDVAIRASRELGVSRAALDAAVKAKTASDPGVLELSAKTGDPRSATLWTNAYATAFADQVAATEDRENARALARIQEQVVDVERRLRRAGGGPLATGLSASLQGLQTQAAEQAVAPRDVARIIQRDVKGKQVAPLPARDAALAFVAMLLLGTLAVVLLSRTRDVYASGLDAAQDVRLPLLAEIPKTKAGDYRQVEAFRTLRERLLTKALARPSGGLGDMIMVTSPESGTGKSFTATNLASSFATADRETLLVDADLRRPTIHEELGLDPEPGLASWLRADPDSSEFRAGADGARPVRRVEVNPGGHTLHVLTSGEPGDDAPELLGSRQMTSALEMLHRNFSTVVVDSPPTGGLADTLVLGREVDSVILVVDLRRTRRRNLRRAVQILRAIDANIAGLILNRAPGGGDARYNDYYRAGRARVG